MNLYVYADESGVLDPAHYEYYTFGGAIFVGTDAKVAAQLRYKEIEAKIRAADPKFSGKREIKAAKLSNRFQAKLLEALADWHFFGATVAQRTLPDYVFASKKTKQRYLDYVFKHALIEALRAMMGRGVFEARDVENVYVRMDQHSASTNDVYELTEGLEEDLKYGLAIYECHRYFPPLFPSMGAVNFSMRDSTSDALIRAADMMANHLLDRARGEVGDLGLPSLHVVSLPEPKDERCQGSHERCCGPCEQR